MLTPGSTAPAPPRRPDTAWAVAPLGAAHLSAYRALMLHAYAIAPDAFTSTPEERAAAPEAWWRQRLEDPQGLSRTFGAFDGDALVGAVTLECSPKPKTRHKAHLVGMFVREHARGRGAARALLQAALDDARARPAIRLVTLTVTEGNRAATALYESAGFQPFGVEPMAVATDTGFVAKVHLWLAFGAAPTA